jgi:hypothetical protein
MRLPLWHLHKAPFSEKQEMYRHLPEDNEPGRAVEIAETRKNAFLCLVEMPGVQGGDQSVQECANEVGAAFPREEAWRGRRVNMWSVADVILLKRWMMCQGHLALSSRTDIAMPEWRIVSVVLYKNFGKTASRHSVRHFCTA